MITAAVIVLVAGFSTALGYKLGSHEATENAVECIEEAFDSMTVPGRHKAHG